MHAFRLHDGLVLDGARAWGPGTGPGTSKGRENAIELRGKVHTEVARLLEPLWVTRPLSLPSNRRPVGPSCEITDEYRYGSAMRLGESFSGRSGVRCWGID